MSNTPDQDKTPSKENKDPSNENSPWFVTPMGDKPQSSEKPKAEPVKPKAEPEKPKAEPKKPTESFEELASKPVSVAPKKKEEEKKPTPVADSSITVDEKVPAKESKDSGVSMPSLIVDGIAAVVAITFTVLIFLDVKDFL